MKMTTENMKRFEDMVRDFAYDNNLRYKIRQDFDNGMTDLEFSIMETKTTRNVVVDWNNKKSLSQVGASVFAYITREFDLDHAAKDPDLVIKNVVFNDPATIVMWGDGTKTVVKVQDGDAYSKEHGLAMCIAKKAFGNKGNFNEVFKKWIPEEKTTLKDIPIIDDVKTVGHLYTELRSTIKSSLLKLLKECED